MMPLEHRLEVGEYFDTGPGGGDPAECEIMTTGNYEHANPYLRWPVILDEYIRNRDVWQCGSARVNNGATFILPGPDWLGHLKATVGLWGPDVDGDQFGPCLESWPPGWGGVVTDSALQGRYAAIRSEEDVAQKAFVQNYAVNGPSYAGQGAAGLKLAEVDDVVKFVVIADGGAQTAVIATANLAYPDICALACPCWEADWENCPWTQDCGKTLEMMADRELLKGRGRHLGGTNIGFLDGHAAWFAAQYILDHGTRYSQGWWSGSLVPDEFLGLSGLGPTNAPDGSVPTCYYCDLPHLY